MADEKPVVKSPSLLNYFQLKSSKLKSDCVDNSKSNENKVKIVDTDCNNESKKRKKKKNSSVNESKKLKLSTSLNDKLEGADKCVDSERIESSQSASEVSYLDFCDKEKLSDESSIQLKSTVVDDVTNVEYDSFVDIESVEKVPEKNIRSFFDRKPLKNVEKNIEKTVKLDNDEIFIKSDQRECEQKLKKKSQMTLSFSGDKLKLSKQIEEKEMEPEQDVDDSIVVLNSEQEDEIVQEKGKKKRKKKLKKKKSLSVSEGTNESEEKRCAIVEVRSVESMDCDETSTDLSIEKNDEKPRRSFLEVMSEAREKKGLKTKKEKDDDKSTKKRSKKKAMNVEDQSEQKNDVTDGRPERNLRRSSRRKVTPVAISDDEISEFTDTDKRESTRKKRRLAPRAEPREKLNKKTKTAQLAQQILSKAKQKDSAKTKNVNQNRAKVKDLKEPLVDKKSSKNSECFVVKSDNVGKGKVAAIFSRKKKPTKAELKAMEEEKARREAFLKEGIPAEMRLKVARSIQATAAISSFLPFPGPGHSHSGLSESQSTNEDGITTIKLRTGTSCPVIPYNTTSLKGFNNSGVESTKQECEFTPRTKLSDDVIQSLLEKLKEDYSDFPVRDMFESLRRRKADEIAKNLMMHSKEMDESKAEVITLSDDEGKSKKKKKSKRKKSCEKKKVGSLADVEGVIEKKDEVPEEVNNCSDLSLVELYCPAKGSDVIGNHPVKKRLKTWLNEWKEKVDREERILNRRLEKELKKSKKGSVKLVFDDDDSDFRISDEDLSHDQSSVSNTILLTGDHGLGKTSMVYAIAHELGYKVFEVSSCSKRNGKVVLSQLQEATQSQHVSKSINSPTVEKDITPVFGIASSKIQSTTLSESIPKRQSSCLSLILFDEVDVVFEEDKGFWQAIESFMKSTKKPMIMTTSDRHFKSHFENSIEELVFKTPKISHICCYLSLVCLCEDLYVNEEDLQDLVYSFNGDIRKCLNHLQFLLNGGGGVKSLEVQIPKVKTDKANEIPEEKRKEMLNNHMNSDDDDFIQPKAIKDEKISLPTVSDIEFHDVYRHDSIFQSCHALDSTYFEYLRGRILTDTKSISNLTCDQELIYANSRHTLPIAKEVRNVSYPVYYRLPAKTEKKMETIEELFDDEKSDHEPDKEETRAPVPNENSTEDNISRRSKESIIQDYKALRNISTMMDTFSWTDSHCIRARESRSEYVTISAGLDDSENMETHSILDSLRDDITSYSRLLSLNLTRKNLQELDDIEAIPIEKDESSIRQFMDFNLNAKAQLSLNRCKGDVKEQLGHAVAMDTNAVVMDYIPTLRDIVKTELIKEAAKKKRRFFHYLENISLNLSQSTLDTLALWF